MMRLMMALLAVLSLTACAADREFASDAEVAAAQFVSSAPTSVTLFTVISTRNGSGAHSGMLINGAERVIYDPAGTWHHPKLPERYDMHYGMSEKMVNFYIDYHARETFNVVEQTVPVTPQQAALVKARAQQYGAARKAYCSSSITEILSGVPGFESVGRTMLPKILSQGFAALPGVTTRTITDDDADENHGVLLVQANGQPFPEGQN